MNIYEKQYYKIVKGEHSKKYDTAIEQGEAIKRCTILKDVNIQYYNDYFDVYDKYLRKQNEE